MSVLEYKEFQSIEEFQKYYEDVYNSILGDYHINRDHFWRGMKSKDGIKYILYFSNSKNANAVSKSKIGFIGSGLGLLYFYKDINKVYTVTIGEGIDYRSFETKLYHLTHGPKAISIPEAFRILAL